MSPLTHSASEFSFVDTRQFRVLGTELLPWERKEPGTIRYRYLGCIGRPVCPDLSLLGVGGIRAVTVDLAIFGVKRSFPRKHKVMTFRTIVGMSIWFTFYYDVITGLEEKIKKHKFIWSKAVGNMQMRANPRFY